MKKSINDWLDAYGESHQNPTNKTLHWICVPIITWTVIALAWGVSFAHSEWLNLGSLLIVLSLFFYISLSLTLTLGMAVFSALCVWLVQLHIQYLPFELYLSSLVLFVLAWVVQFIGHKIEGKKPSFFEDIQFLLIAPAWLLSFIYRRLGIPL